MPREQESTGKGEKMGVKRFLVAAGMASLVLIGVVPLVDAEAMASIFQASDQSRVDKWTNRANTACERQECMDKAQNTRDSAVSTWENMRNGGTTGGGTNGSATTGGGTNGSATTGGGTNGSATTGGGTDGSATTGSGSDMETVSFEILPETGGLPVVLLLTSALLLGSGLLMVAIVRSVRS